MTLNQFGNCKDQQYVILLHLLDEISCINNFFLYTVIFRGGEFDMWLHALFRLAMVFIVFNQQNYNKTTLCQLSDLLFHLSDIIQILYGKKFSEPR